MVMTMTYRDFAKTATEQLKAVSGEDAAFEVRCLLEDLAGLPHGALPDERELSPAAQARLDRALAERLQGRPLQYILGEWDFLSLRLKVGEGVLIPRPDTELLCETAADILHRMPGADDLQVLDLCAGSGCVGLGIAALEPRARVTAVEKSPQAFAYLTENRDRYPTLPLTAVSGDITTDAHRFPDEVDAIVSNPPYIPASDLPTLMREVRKEPQMALNGGEDGLDFYRVIAERWVPKLRPGGLCAVEIGFDQGAAVDGLFAAAGLIDRKILKDLAGHDRVVLGFRPQ